MSKFCTRCGKPLEEGQVCDCSINVAAVTNNSNSSATTALDFNDFITIIKGIFTRPADTIKEFAKSEKALLGLVAILINCIVSGLFYYFFCDKTLGGYMSLFTGGFSSSYSSLLSGSISLPFGKLFFMGFLFLLFWFAVCGFVIFIIANAILKDKMDIKKAFALVGVCSVFTTITTLVAWLFLYIKIQVSLVILVIAAGFYLTHLYQGLSDTTEVDRNKLVYVFMPAVSLATFVMVYFVPKFFS